MLGNDQNDAALEVTLPGFGMTVSGECCAVLSGADLGMRINGAPAAPWTVHLLRPGDRLSTASLAGDGCRSYLCFSGGIDVPLIMGSRSTYARAKLGGYRGRALAPGDVVELCEPPPLWRASAGFVCPHEFRPTNYRAEPLCATDGPQVGAFTDEGLATFYGREYVVTNEADRMGYRLDGPQIARCGPADIVSDGVVFGSVQVPGHGRPIVMMADRQTAGGYAKIATLCAWSAAQLAQRLPGEAVRFERITEREAVGYLARFEETLGRLDALRATYRTRGKFNGQGH
jgi:biotin-dependent carboxylase-like uncharacterized protein